MTEQRPTYDVLDARLREIERRQREDAERLRRALERERERERERGKANGT